MSDLEELGLIHAPHTSAGRVPTRMGYRMFIDYLLTVEPLKDEAVDKMQSRFALETDPRSLLSTASEMLSNVTHFAGLDPDSGAGKRTPATNRISEIVYQPGAHHPGDGRRQGTEQGHPDRPGVLRVGVGGGGKLLQRCLQWFNLVPGPTDAVG